MPALHRHAEQREASKQLRDRSAARPANIPPYPPAAQHPVALVALQQLS